MEGEFQYAKQTRSTSWIQSYNSFTDVEEEIFFFFCMLWMEEELNYTREINILLLLHSHHPDISLSIYKRRKKFFFFYILRWKGSFNSKSLPTLILVSEFTEEEKIFFFHILRVEGEFHYAKQTLLTSWIPNISFTDEEEELFFFFCMLRIEGELHYKRGINILLLLHSQSGRGDLLENLCPPRY